MKKPADQRTLLKLYRKARTAIAKKGAWLQGIPLANSRGREVAMEEKASRFCATGVLDHVAYKYYNGYDDHGLFDERSIGKPLAEAIGVRNGRAVERWNDREERTQKEVVAAYDKAIKLIASRMQASP